MIIAGLGCALLIACAALAQNLPGQLPGKRLPGMPSEKSGDQLVKVTGLADVQRISPGQQFHLAFILDIEPHWHIYWQNSGASGGPTEVQVSAPPGFVIGRTLYPRPRTFQGEEGTTYGYEDQTVLFVEVTAPESISLPQAMFTANIEWMVCKDVCLLGRATQRINLPAGQHQPLVPSDAAPAIDSAVGEHKSRLPKPMNEYAGANVAFADSVLTITMPARDQDTAEFFPLDMPGVSYGEPAIQMQDQQITITVPVEVNPKDSLGRPMSVKGTVGLGTSQTDPAFEFEIPLSAP